jgi:ABC-type transport system involved in multi-copper enzyme maturation permease subunit
MMHAELIKLRRSALPWVVGGLCVLLDVLLFATYAASDSSVFEAGLLPFGQVVSLFLGSFIALVNVVPAVLIGSYVGARDYSNRTAGSEVHRGGRYRPLLGKILATVVALCALVLATGVLGLLLGLAHDTDVAHVDTVRLLQQLAIAMASTAMLGLLALTVATLARSLAAASLTTLAALLGQMFLPPDAGQVVRFLNPLTFLGGAAESAFSNLAGLTNFSVTFGSELSVGQSIVGLLGYVVCCLATLALVARFREYR